MSICDGFRGSAGVGSYRRDDDYVSTRWYWYVLCTAAVYSIVVAPRPYVHLLISVGTATKRLLKLRAHGAAGNYSIQQKKVCQGVQSGLNSWESFSLLRVESIRRTCLVVT